MKLIEALNLKKTFDRKVVLENASFDVEQGSFTALLGKNGSGKSTTLNLLMGNTKLDEGRCLLFGKDIQSNHQEIMGKIGHVSENIRFDYPLTMERFFQSYSKFFPKFDIEYLHNMARDLKFDLTKEFGSYSRGQKMQVVLMSALAQNPDLLLIDEITSVLDNFSRNYFVEKLHRFHQAGKTVVLTTNIVSEVQHLCSDVIFLSEKKIKFQSSMMDIPLNFKKVRWVHKDRPLPEGPYILSVTNSDGSTSYVIPVDFLSQALAQGCLEDLRNVTLEDLYAFHSQEEVA